MDLKAAARHEEDKQRTRHDEICYSINRVADAIEEHHKVMSKIAHIIGFKMEDLAMNLNVGMEGIVLEIRKGRE